MEHVIIKEAKPKMEADLEDIRMPTSNFYSDLPALTGPQATFDATFYRPAPDDWLIALTDVRNSTGAIERGLYKTVNYVAAAAIAALKNLAAPQSIPFLFGGDGSVVMVPPNFADEARLVLARLRGFTAREFALDLRVGAVRVGELRRFGAEVLVGRYEPTPGNNFAVFLGGGVAVLEAALKGRGDPDLARTAAIPDALDDRGPLNFTGLSCRWSELRSKRGKMISLIINAGSNLGPVYDAVLAIASEGGNPNPVRLDTLATQWPPAGYMLEAHTRRGKWPVQLAAARVLVETLVAYLALAANRTIGRFDPKRYRQEITANTDFSKHDQTLSFVVDCPAERIETIQTFLDRRAEAGELTYGMHLSETALMTCLVTDTSVSRHVHFIDGGNGGYASAARHLKARLADIPI
jgi:hypothetical protein